MGSGCKLTTKNSVNVHSRMAKWTLASSLQLHVNVSPCLRVTVSRCHMSPCLCHCVNVYMCRSDPMLSPWLCVPVPVRLCILCILFSQKPGLFQEVPLKKIHLCLPTLSSPFFIDSHEKCDSMHNLTLTVQCTHTLTHRQISIMCRYPKTMTHPIAHALPCTVLSSVSHTL